MMRRGRNRRSLLHRGLVPALWANFGALVALVAVLVARGGENSMPSFLPAAYAQVPAPIAGGGGLYVMPAQLASNVWGVYLLDVDRQSLMVYRYDASGGGELKFLAAREVQHDRQLGNYNTFPDPLEIKAIAEKEQQTSRLPPEGNR